MGGRRGRKTSEDSGSEDEVELASLPDEPVAGVEEPNTASDEARAVAKAEMARIADEVAWGDAAI